MQKQQWGCHKKNFKQKIGVPSKKKKKKNQIEHLTIKGNFFRPSPQNKNKIIDKITLMAVTL
jgi:hypothetical protein